MKSNKRVLLFITILAVCMLALSPFAYAKPPVLRMATTTSTEITVTPRKRIQHIENTTPLTSQTNATTRR